MVQPFITAFISKKRSKPAAAGSALGQPAIFTLNIVLQNAGSGKNTVLLLKSGYFIIPVTRKYSHS